MRLYLWDLSAKQHQGIIDELITPYPFQVLPSSIEEKLNFYENRLNLDEIGINYKIVKENFLNYRLLNSKLTYKKTPTPHYTIFYSYLERPQRVRVEFEKDSIFYANRAQVMFVEVKKVNEILKKEYKSVLGLYRNPLSIDEEIDFREALTKSRYNLSPIVVVDEIKEKFDIDIKAKIYPDTREILIKF